MTLYEYPFNERLRTYLRLEHLFQRLVELVARDTDLDHHFALTTIFEIVDVAARADLKSDVLRDLERQKGQLDGLRDNPAVAMDMLEHIIGQIDQYHSALLALPGRAGQSLSDNEFLMALRSRVDIPGGTNSFDLPAYHRWLHLTVEQRKHDLQRWSACLKPLADSLFLLLGMLRDTGRSQKVAATNGHFQQSLPAGRAYQLLRLRIDPELNLVPEISGNRLMVSVRLMRVATEDCSLQAATENADFELTLCA